MKRAGLLSKENCRSYFHRAFDSALEQGEASQTANLAATLSKILTRIAPAPRRQVKPLKGECSLYAAGFRPVHCHFGHPRLDTIFRRPG